MKAILSSLAIIFALASCGAGQNQQVAENGENTNTQESQTQMEEKEVLVYVALNTNKGKIVLELDSSRAPQTVANFLSYVDEGFYDGTIFHRVIDGFMIQGGGFTPDGVQKTTKDPIFLESQNGLENTTGTVAMARTNAPHSATAQFFINVKDNDFLNYKPGNPGYAVFGKVMTGMDVVNEIKKVKTGRQQGMSDWPIEPVIIESASRE